MERAKMNYCEDCRVYVDESLARCPLCGRTLADSPPENGLYPNVTERKYIDRRTFTDDLLVFLTFLFVGGSVLLNLIWERGTPWFLLVAAPILYVWILIRVTILSDLFAGAKALLQLLGIMGAALAFDFVSGFSGWSYGYVLPFALIAGITFIDLYSYIHKSYWRDNLVYAAVFVLLGFLPLVLFLVGLTGAAVPAVLCAFAGALTALGILRFAVSRLSAEIKKRFHL